MNAKIYERGVCTYSVPIPRLQALPVIDANIICRTQGMELNGTSKLLDCYHRLTSVEYDGVQVLPFLVQLVGLASLLYKFSH